MRHLFDNRSDKTVTSSEIKKIDNETSLIENLINANQKSSEFG